jgi:hypothetical protein
VPERPDPGDPAQTAAASAPTARTHPEQAETLKDDPAFQHDWQASHPAQQPAAAGRTGYVRVLHGELGPFSQGDVVRAERFDELDRLLAAGAVAFVAEAEDESARVRGLSLADTMRYPSQWTLPNVPHTDASADEVRGHLGVPPQAASPTTARTEAMTNERAEASRHLGPQPGAAPRPDPDAAR